MMDMKRIEELAALPLPGVVASAPDEYERRRTAYVISIAVNETREEDARWCDANLSAAAYECARAIRARKLL